MSGDRKIRIPIMSVCVVAALCQRGSESFLPHGGEAEQREPKGPHLGCAWLYCEGGLANDIDTWSQTLAKRRNANAKYASGCSKRPLAL